MTAPFIDPRHRARTVQHHRRAITHHWRLAEVAREDSDHGTATVEAVMTVVWDAAYGAYRATLHQHLTWTEAGERHHTRDPRKVLLLALTPAGRFTATRLTPVAAGALADLHHHSTWFEPTDYIEQPELLAA